MGAPSPHPSSSRWGPLLLAAACTAACVGSPTVAPPPGAPQAPRAPQAPPAVATPEVEPAVAAEDPPQAADAEGSAETVPDAEGFRTAGSGTGRYRVAWRPVGEAVPNNEYFRLEVRLWEDGEEPAPLPGARLFVSAWMPDHGHGMVVAPRASDQGDGSYLVDGMLLHMGGHWQLFFDVVDPDGISERAAFDLHVE